MIVVLDACVLYPASLRDLLLTLAALDAFAPRWSDEILDEVTRNVIADYPDIDPARFTSHTIGAMRRAFPDATVQVPVGLVEEMDNDPKDHHVVAVALHANATVIITNNLRHFVSDRLRNAGIEVISPGALVERLLDEAPEVVVTAITHLAERWVSPPRTFDAIIELLAAHASMANAIARVRELRSADEQP